MKKQKEVRINLSEYKDLYYGSILDPIHGQIKLSEIEKWILSQKPFNRLKRIKQNTFLYYVFPSANHTRFEHSIGVMHLASRIFEACLDNYATGRNKRIKYELNEDSSFFDIKGHLPEEELPVIFQELRLAALLHDVGHGPMSHLFDNYTISKSKFLKIVGEDADLKMFLSAFRMKVEKKGKVEHEIMSCLFVVKLIASLKVTARTDDHKFSEGTLSIINKINAKRIVKIIEHDFPEQPNIIINTKDYTPILTSIISSFPLDADRMDYLLRDSYFSGVKYGIYDLSRVFMSFIPAEVDGRVHLVVKESGVDSVIRFIQSRTHLFNQVYYHKTNRAANTMLDFAFQAIPSNTEIISASNYEELESFYWNNTDEAFLWKTFRDKMHPTKKSEIEVFEELLQRKLFKRVYQKKIVLYESINSKKDDRKQFDKGIQKIERTLEKVKSAIDKKIADLNKEGIYLAVDHISTEVYKDEDKTSIYIARKIHSNYKIEKVWSEFNKDFKTMKCKAYTFRIYIRRNFKSSADFLTKRERIFSVLKVELDRLGKFSD